MNINGMDYNTQREKLLMPEYGREVQAMVQHAISLPTKEERQRCAEKIVEVSRPEPIAYPAQDIPVRHYGKMIFETFEKLKSMPEGEERDALARMTANQMKRNLITWGHGSNNEERVASDLARFTDGVIQLDLDTFAFDKTIGKEMPQQTTKKRKRK